MSKHEKRMYRGAIRNRCHWAKNADKDMIQAGSVQSAIISASPRPQAENWFFHIIGVPAGFERR